MKTILHESICKARIAIKLIKADKKTVIKVYNLLHKTRKRIKDVKWWDEQMVL